MAFTPIVQPDAELALIQYLRSRSEITSLVPAARITTVRPQEPTYPLVLIQRIGGTSLAWNAIDEAAYVEARKHGVHRWVTVSIDRVEFKAPVHVGDVVSLYTRPVSFGRSSITVEVRVVAERWLGGASAEVTNATVKMVATDRHGRSIDFRSAPTVVEPS